MKRTSWVLAGAAVLVSVAATGGVVVMSSAAQTTKAALEPPPNTAKVKRGKLSAMVSLGGTLTYRARSDGSPYSVINQARGTYTKLPDNGDKVDCGDVFYRVDDHPVLLLCGTVPAYREGQRMSRGQALAQLDTADLERAAAEAQATLDQQVGALAKLQQGPTPGSVNTAQTQVEGGEANLASAQRGVGAAQIGAAADTQLAQTAIDNAQNAVQDATGLLDAASAQAEAGHQSDAQSIANAQRDLQDAAKGVDAARAQATATLAADQTAVTNAQSALDDVRKALALAQQQYDAGANVDSVSVANAQAAVNNAQKALQRAQQVAGTSQGVQQATIDKAQQDVEAAEANRDAVCGMATSTRAQCDAAKSGVKQAQAARAVTQATAKQTAAQNQQSIQTAQAQLDQANATLHTAQATLASNQVKNQGPPQTAQAKVDSAAGALQAARDTLASDQARQQANIEAAQQKADDALGTLKAAQASAAGNSAKNDQVAKQAQQSLDQAQATLATAQAQATQTAAKGASAVQSAQSQADLAASQLSTYKSQLTEKAAQPTDADLAAAKAQVATAQLQLDQAKANLAAATLHTGDVGENVRQLNQNLHKLGYDAAAGVDIDPDDNAFTLNTEKALEVLQHDKGFDVTGKLAIGDAVFLPESVRIAKVTGDLGVPAQPGAQVASATSNTLVVQVDLSASQQGEVKEGDPAQITLPGNKSVTGKVDRLGRVAQVPDGQNIKAGAATIPAYISLDDPATARGLDKAPVQVDITTDGVDSALSVPVTSLIGKSGGGFAVEVVRDDGRRELVAVKLGLFDTAGGRVEVEGDLGEGDQVVVPSL